MPSWIHVIHVTVDALEMRDFAQAAEIFYNVQVLEELSHEGVILSQK